MNIEYLLKLIYYTCSIVSKFCFIFNNYYLKVGIKKLKLRILLNYQTITGDLIETLENLN